MIYMPAFNCSMIHSFVYSPYMAMTRSVGKLWGPGRSKTVMTMIASTRQAPLGAGSYARNKRWTLYGRETAQDERASSSDFSR